VLPNIPFGRKIYGTQFALPVNIKIKTIKELTMYFKLASTKPRFTNCPHCESTDTFLSMYNDARYCVNCNKLYDRTDETRLREQKMDVACGLFNPSNVNVTVPSSNEIPMPV
jgi:transposase-like protein